MNQRIIELAQIIKAYESINGEYPQHTIGLLLNEILKPSLVIELNEGCI